MNTVGSFDFKRRIGGVVLGLIAVSVRMIAWMFSLISSVLEKRTVVIFEPFGMGDIISLDPLVKVLIKNNIKTLVVAKERWNQLLPPSGEMSWVDCELPWTSYDSDLKYTSSSYFNRKFITSLFRIRRICKGGIGIDPRGDIRSVILLYLFGCYPVFSIDHYLGDFSRMITGAVTEKVKYDDLLRRWEINLRFLPFIDIKEVNVAPPCLIHLTSCDSEKNRSKIGLIPIAPWKGRLWQNSKWKEVVSKLASSGIQSVGLCGPGQTCEVRTALGDDIVVREAKSITDWAEMLSDICVVVSLDSGPMHLADALGIPVVGLFGPGKLPLWAPSGKLSVVIHHQDKVESVPCHQVDESVEFGLKAMDLISVEEIIDAVLGIDTETACESGKSCMCMDNNSARKSKGVVI
ncbi:MAG: glycosyltransferase family 9 protein [Kiritimatiellae bacterium]|nr:glycosyltransferase family 9 protein [Kiritimatiellia bacterium]MDD5523065.1 glycosyltransferase family 9 protein [Kiritimatiellia bacterium]